MRNVMEIKVLVIEDEEYDVQRILRTVEPFRDTITVETVVSNGKDALEFLRERNHACDVIIMDYQISGGLYGEALIREIHAIDPTLKIIIITKRTINKSNIQFANELIQTGAYWFGTKYPADIEDYIYQPTDFNLLILNAYNQRQSELRLRRSQGKFDRKIVTILQDRPLLGQSSVMIDLREAIARYAHASANVLITGESGTGKELVALHLHYNSPRKYENFVPVNCAAIPKDLIESELFGFVRGSFTGARDGKKGLFEQANGGTIFLDEICELPLPAQAKLLRVLETGEIDKIGRNKSYRVSLRVLAATNRNIRKRVAKGQFREDLFYRLNILQIKTPPLREHREDIPELLTYFLHHFAGEENRIPPRVGQSALDLLSTHDWPGNVRQLKNIAQRLIIIAPDTIREEDVRRVLTLTKSTPDPDFGGLLKSAEILPWKEADRKFRRAYFRYVRSQCRTDAEAAQKLNLAPSNFHRMCKDLSLK
ncbi:MAG: sigma-54-dependent Fis family transcriptional regulator [Candidatus Neomarinimicrobiota bacterium]|nr:MAG: sigma-54-dependent Fis family transcriptional regulator [Candidatus Neomarinimicrobiota bacterium]